MVPSFADAPARMSVHMFTTDDTRLPDAHILDADLEVEEGHQNIASR